MKHILIVDDDPQFAQIIQHQLERKDYKVDIAYQQDEVLKLVQANAYSLILIDVYFPNRENGLDVLKRLHEYTKQQSIPLVLITSMTNQFFAEEDHADQYLSISKEFISKMDGPAHIVERVGEILGE